MCSSLWEPHVPSMIEKASICFLIMYVLLIRDYSSFFDAQFDSGPQTSQFMTTLMFIAGWFWLRVHVLRQA